MRTNGAHRVYYLQQVLVIFSNVFNIKEYFHISIRVTNNLFLYIFSCNISSLFNVLGDIPMQHYCRRARYDYNSNTDSNRSTWMAISAKMKS